MEKLMMTNLERFFLIDLNIKKEMFGISPVKIGDYYDEHTISRYVEYVNSILINIFDELEGSILNIFGAETSIYIKTLELEQTIKNEFYKCGYDLNKLKNFYQKYITNMTDDFINAVKKDCIGYSINEKSSINMISSVNELLHFIHSSIVNNEKILQSMPVIAQKHNNDGYPITLRGNVCPYFRQIYDLFSTDLDCAWTDLVAINDHKLIMMVRDRGHALSIEITINDKIARIEYFVPKICNISMVNSLPGINKVASKEVGTTGVVETTIEELPTILFDIISKVPTDADIDFDNYKAL